MLDDSVSGIYAARVATWDRVLHSIQAHRGRVA